MPINTTLKTDIAIEFPSLVKKISIFEHIGTNDGQKECSSSISGTKIEKR